MKTQHNNKKGCYSSNVNLRNVEVVPPWVNNLLRYSQKIQSMESHLMTYLNHNFSRKLATQRQVRSQHNKQFLADLSLHLRSLTLKLMHQCLTLNEPPSKLLPLETIQYNATTLTVLSDTSLWIDNTLIKCRKVTLHY